MTKKYVELNTAVKLAIECFKYHVPCPSALISTEVFDDVALSLDELNEVAKRKKVVKKKTVMPRVGSVSPQGKRSRSVVPTK